ncbi:MAG TPA: AAA family ATPase [Chloroflexota bacterium]|nr:AAA family ATPase [Chloroflexota bacterium]
MAIVPVGQYSGPIEGKSPPSNGLRLLWSSELAERLNSGLPLTVLGQAALDPPLGRLLVVGRSDSPGNGTATMALAAVVVPEGSASALMLAPFGLGPLAGAMQPPAELRDHFRVRRTSEAVYVQDHAGADVFVVGPGVVLNQLVIACGSWPLLAPLFGPRVRARPIGELAAIQRDLNDFCAVVSASVNALYRRQRKQPPAVTLTLRPTGLNVESALGGLRWLGKSAADLVSRLPGAPSFAPLDARRAIVSEVTPGASFDEVGGQEEAKRELQAICLAIRDPEAYRRWGARPPKGVLLYGPPGTGKTLLARCLAREAGARFIHVRATDVTSKWYGEAEKRLQAAFDRARKEAPAVIFFDEIDAIARAREDSHEATHRVVSTLLENMDGLEESKGVVVIAATNRPEAVDSALTRPGRFDRLVEVPLPNRNGRRSIFDVHLRKAEASAGRGLFEPLQPEDWDRLLDASEGFSGAEIEETVRRTLEAKVRAGATDGQIAFNDILAQAGTVNRPW